jgi:hypothetical protein
MIEWVLWALLLLAQNASFTWTSRARNSGSLAYNGAASVFSNLIWFAGQLVVISKAVEYRNNMTMLIITALFYTLWCVVGSVSAQYVLMRWVETGKRRVGAK